jgi:hypothetical protein
VLLPTFPAPLRSRLLPTGCAGRIGPATCSLAPADFATRRYLAEAACREWPLTGTRFTTPYFRSWPIGDGQPVLEFSWLTTHGRAASLTPTEATASPECRRSSGFPSSEGVDKTRRRKASRNRNAISSIVLYSLPSCGGSRTLRPTRGGTERTV